MDEREKAQGLTGDEGYSRAEQDFRSAARLEAEEDERQAAQLAIRSRSLADVAFEAMSRGDQVAAGTGGREFQGRVVHASGNLMTLQVPAGVVDFNLEGPVQIRILEHATSGGETKRSGPGNFRGRLLELEAFAQELELGSPLFPDDNLRGRLRVAAQDHVVFEDAANRKRFIPLAWLAYVARLSE